MEHFPHANPSDARVWRLAQAVAKQAVDESGPFDASWTRDTAADVATGTAMLLLKAIYENDAELLALRAERDYYKALAERAIALSPPPPVVLHMGVDEASNEKP